MHAVQK